MLRELRRHEPVDRALRAALAPWHERNRRMALAGALAAAVVLVMTCTVLGLASGSDAASEGSTATWVEMPRSAERVAGVQAVLDRRAAAVRARDKAKYLADIDRSDQDFVKRQTAVYDNLVQLALTELTYRVEASIAYPKLVPAGIDARFHAAVFAPGVTVRYRIDGIDARPVAAPWVPVLAYTDGRWMVVGEVTGSGLPYGTNGQAWDAGPIWVGRSSRVVAVFSADDARRSSYLLDLAEQSLDRVRSVRVSGWDGKVFVTAVQDRRIFDAYFAESPERITKVSAVAVTYYDRVTTWHKEGVFAATRVVLNPQQLAAQPDELAHGLTHEFTHAAMAPVTTASTPRWLVEGFAEYVAYKSGGVSAAPLRKQLSEITSVGDLPANDRFYQSATNYALSWLACRMIAEQYGEPKLIALFESFQQRNDAAANISAALGVSLDVVTAQWREYVQKFRT